MNGIEWNVCFTSKLVDGRHSIDSELYRQDQDDEFNQKITTNPNGWDVECRIDKSTWKQFHSVHVIKFSRKTYNVVAELSQCLWDANHFVIVCACL